MSVITYADVQKSANDLIKDSFCLDRKFKLTTKTDNGVTFTTEGSLSDKGSDNKFGSKFKVDFLSVDKLQATSAGRFILEASVKDIVPNLKFATKFEDGVSGSGEPKGSVSATFNQPMFTVFTEIDLMKGPTLSESVTFQYEGFIAGAEVKYDSQLEEKEPKPALSGVGALVGFAAKDFSTSLKAADMGKKLSLAVHHVVNPQSTLAVLFDLEPSGTTRTLTVAGTYKLDDATSFAGKVDSKGIVTASHTQILRPFVKLMTSAQVDTKNFAGDSHKFGLQLILG